MKTGTNIWRESGVEFFFGEVEKEGQKTTYAQYIVNALGAFRGFRLAKENRDGVECAVKLDNDQGVYTIEAAFPLKTANYDLSGEKVLTFTAWRNVYTRNSYEGEVYISWHPGFYSPGYYRSRGLIFME